MKQFRFLFYFILVGQVFSIKVLVNDSFYGKSAPSAWLEKEFKKQCKKCHLEFIPAGDFTGLYQKIKEENNLKQRAKKNLRGNLTSHTFHYVIGLNDYYYREALKRNLVRKGRIVDRGTYSLIADSKKVNLSRTKEYSWKELGRLLESKVIIQDPRFSSVGVGWLRVVYEQKALEEKAAKKMIARTFPSWQPSYSAFTKEVAPVVWSYATSEAYHLCSEKTKRYFAIKVRGGYPEQREWAARVNNLQLTPKEQVDLKRFEKIVFSKQGQLNIAKTNWMLPGIGGLKMPDCFKNSLKIKTWQPKRVSSLESLRVWKDRWNL